MTKAIVTSDIHIHTYKQFNEGGRRLKYGIAYLDYLFKLAAANNIKYILLPGDLMNNMQVIATKVVNAIVICLNRNFEKYPDISIIAISGNHDFAEKNLKDQPAESALVYLAEAFPNRFRLIDDGQFTTLGGNSHVNIVGIPYYEHKEHFREALERSISRVLEDAVNILLMHQSVASGLPIDDDIEATDPLFNAYDMVFNGHIHTNSLVQSYFVNVGSPMHRDAGDIGQDKGFWLVDLDIPAETVSFKPTLDRFPRYIHKFIGEELTEEEAKQYVIWVPNPVAENPKDHEVAQKFNTSIAPADLLKNFCAAILSEAEMKEKLSYGLTLLS